MDYTCNDFYLVRRRFIPGIPGNFTFTPVRRGRGWTRKGKHALVQSVAGSSQLNEISFSPPSRGVIFHANDFPYRSLFAKFPMIYKSSNKLANANVADWSEIRSPFRTQFPCVAVAILENKEGKGIGSLNRGG